MNRTRPSHLLILGALAVGLLSTGCATNSTSMPNAVGATGSIHGGQQPVSGATVQLYAVGTAGDGSSATPLLTPAAVSDANGNFNISGPYNCPSQSSLVYIVGTGGSPGSGITNSQIAMMAALGPCSSLGSIPFVNIDEVTTVAAVYALAPYITSFSAIGSGTSDATTFAQYFTAAGYIANIGTGTAPGTFVPANYSVPIAQVNTLANLLGSCINSPGGVSGDSSLCGQFFALTLPSGGTISTDTIGALLNLANNPTLNTNALFNLISASAIFQPTDSATPPDFAVRLLVNSLFTVSPSSLTFASTVLGVSAPSQTVTVTNGTAASVNVTSASIIGVNATDYSIAGTTCGSAVPANSSCTYQVSFTPTASGARAGYLVLANSSANSSIAVALSGIGTPLVVGQVFLSPYSQPFPSTTVGSTSSASFLLYNSGNVAYPIISVSNSNSDFASTNNCGSRLPAPGSCLITITFTPSVAAPEPNTLTVQYNVSNTPFTVSSAMTAYGRAPQLVFSSSNMSFNNIPLGSVSSPVNVALFNYTAAPVSNLVIGYSGAGASQFSETNDCPATLAANALCTFVLTATPAQVGSAIANLNVSAGGYRATLFEVVVGVAGLPTNNPLVLSDTQFVVPSSSSVMTMTNTGTGPIVISSITTSTGFSQTNTCGVVLAAGATCNVQPAGPVVPQGSAPVIGTLTVNSNALTPVQTVTLYAGSAVHDFGPVIVGYPSGIWSQYANYGQVSNSGPNAGDFPITGNNGGCGRVGPCYVYTQFVPTALGNRVGYSRNQSLTTLMAGIGIPTTGQVTSFSISAATIDFGTYVIGSTAPQPITLTLTNTGNQPVPINSIATSSSFFLGYQFPQTNTCGSSLAVGSTCTITVSFSNTNGGGGGASGNLAISTYSLTPAINIPLYANPVMPQAGFSLSSSNVTLAQTQAGTPSTSQTVTLTNTGNIALTVNVGPYTSGGAVFTETTNCGAVAAGGNCTISIDGTPPSVGTFSDVLPISIANTSLTQNISVSVTGN